MTVQDILNSVSTDMRQVLSASSDTNILIPWVDRIQKDALHSSLFNYLLRKVQTTAITVNQSTVTLVDGSSVALPIRRILSVYDRTFDRLLLPYDSIAVPSVKADAESPVQAPPPPEPMVSAATMLQWPSYYMRLGSNVVQLFPAAQKSAFAGSYEFYYETYSPDLTAVSDTLLIPNDGKDLVVAGVNAYAAAYLKNPEDYSAWKGEYEKMKGGAFPA